MATRFELEELARDHLYLGDDHDRNEHRTWLVIALTATMMVADIAAGTIFGSMALVADGWHMSTHAAAMLIAVLAYGFARRNAHNPRFTFGTGKVGDLAGFGSALVLGIFAIAIAAESVARLFNPTQIDFGDAIVVAVIGLAVNLVSAAMLQERQHGHGHHHDHNLRAAYLHVLADALTSVGAIAALVAGRFLGWVWLDPVIAIVASLVIARWSWTLVRQTAAVLLDTADRGLLERMKSAVEEGGDCTIADLHVWRIGPGAHAAIVTASGAVSSAEIRRRLSLIGGLAHLTIEVRLSGAED